MTSCLLLFTTDGWCHKYANFEMPWHINSFFANQPKLLRSVLVGITVLEFLALNQMLDLFGIIQRQKNDSLHTYLSDTLAHSFPTFSNNGPMLDGTEIRSLALILGLCSQNYFLHKWLNNPSEISQNKNMALEAVLLTCSAGILAWALCVLKGDYHNFT